MAMKNEVNAPMFVVIIIVSALFLLVTVIGVDAWYKMEEQAEVDTKWSESPNTWLLKLRADEQANLDANRRINRSHHHVPIGEAMRIFVAQQQQGEQSSAGTSGGGQQR